MGAYNYEYFIKDFIYRTRKNHMKIWQRYEEDESQRYEVTQLINSLFGLLIVPNEKYKYKRNGQGVTESYLQKTEEYEEILEIINELKSKKRHFSSYKDDYEVSDFIRHMRNSLAHSGNQGIHFLPCQEGQEITSVIFYDNKTEHGVISEFCVELTIQEIRDLSQSISDMYSKIEETDEDNIEKRKVYLKEIDYCRELMKKG